MGGGATINYIQKAQILMNSAMRFATGAPKRTSISKLFKQCGWLTLDELNKFHSTLHLWKIIGMNKPMYMRRTLEIDTESKLSTAYPRLQFTAGCYRWRGIQYWNSMPDSLRNNLILPKFKKQLKLWIIQQRPPEPD